MRSATLIGSSLVVLALVGVEVGCRSNNGTGGTGAGGAGTTSTTTKATTGATMTTGTTGTTNPTTTVSATSTSGTSTTASTGTAMCKTPQTMPHAPGTAPLTLFCPFGNAMNNDYCDPSKESCCEVPAGMTTMCVANSSLTMGVCPMTGTNGYMDWGCASPADCSGATPVCCTNGGATIAQNMVNGMACPGDFFASKMHFTSCVASVTACQMSPNDPTMPTGAKSQGIVMCLVDSDCKDPAHPKCQPFRKSGADVGGCQ